MPAKKGRRNHEAAVQAASANTLDSLLALLQRALRIEGLNAPEHRAAAIWALGLSAVAMVLRVIFWAYTHRYWEDSLITCLHSENFWSGHGLTHVRPGEAPLHGFTSPLSVLVPLVGDMFHIGFGVEFLKLVSIPASALTVLYLMGIALHPSVRLPLPMAVMVAGYAAIEHQQILFGMAGMETQLAVLVIVASLYHCIAWHPGRLGVWLGLSMLARPDFAFWCAIIGCYGLYRDWRRIPLVVGVALALYLPWIAFTTFYYGSPIPHTMVAKGLGYLAWHEKVTEITLSFALTGAWMVLSRILVLGLAPMFAGHGGLTVVLWEGSDYSLMANLMFAFALVAVGVVMAKRQFALWPLAAAAIAYAVYYIWFVPVVAGWYLPPFMLLMLSLSSIGIAWCTGFVPEAALREKLRWGITLVYLAAFAFWLPYTFYAEHQIQRYVENGVRMPAGLFMKEKLAGGAAVGCEPLGYMGYYSRGNVYDWPGLDSRKVVAWSESVPQEQRKLENMLKALQPQYLYLRDVEVLNFEDRQWFIDRYLPIKQFRVAEEDRKKVPWIEKNVDIAFWVYERRAER